jgi:peptidoglycan DL-endopeptidase CwlO
MKRFSPRRRAWFLAVIVGVGGMSAFTFTTAGATPATDAQAQASQLESQINANAVKLDALNEQIKAAQDQLDQANATIADSQTRIAAAKTQTDALQGLVEQRAASIYQGASNGTGTSLFNIDPSELASSQKYTQAASDQDNALVDQLNQAKQELNAREKDAQSAKSAAETQKAALAAAESSFQATNGQYSALLAQVKGQLVTLVAQAQAQRDTQAAPKATGGGNGGNGGNGGGQTFDPGSIPAASGRGGVAVGYAQAQLGKPYCYAGTGPGCYDCSGLTMMAWGAAGVGLPHNSESQIGSFPNVPMSALAAGDVVWSPGHVGVYAGGGAVIHAPHTGDVVRYIDVGYFERAMRPG